jgi:polar amino acid transport system substrate-binding protein
MPGVLTACVSTVGSPAAGLTEEGQLDGYNVAFANELATRLGLQIDIQQPLFEDLIDQISGHACDVSVSSQNISTSRAEQVTFVPYTRSRQPVLVEIGNPESIFTLQDLCGLPVSATTGTTHVDLVEGVGDYVGQGLNDQCTTAGSQPIDLRTFQTELEAVTALLDGEVIAYLGNPSFVFDFADRIIYSPASLPPAQQGIAIAQDHPNLVAAVESALSDMISDGVYRGILVQYLPNEASVDAVSIEEAPAP